MRWGVRPVSGRPAGRSDLVLSNTGRVGPTLSNAGPWRSGSLQTRPACAVAALSNAVPRPGAALSNAAPISRPDALQRRAAVSLRASVSRPLGSRRFSSPLAGLTLRRTLKHDRRRSTPPPKNLFRNRDFTGVFANPADSCRPAGTLPSSANATLATAGRPAAGPDCKNDARRPDPGEPPGTWCIHLRRRRRIATPHARRHRGRIARVGQAVLRQRPFDSDDS